MPIALVVVLSVIALLVLRGVVGFFSGLRRGMQELSPAPKISKVSGSWPEHLGETNAPPVDPDFEEWLAGRDLPPVIGPEMMATLRAQFQSAP